MARFSGSYSYRRARQRKMWFSAITAALIIITLLVLTYMYFGGDEDARSVPDVRSQLPEPVKDIVVIQSQRPEPEIKKPPVEPALINETPAVPEDTDPETDKLIKQAIECTLDPVKTVEARGRLNDLLAMPLSGNQRQLVKKTLSDLSDKWLFSSDALPGDRLCGYYKVQSGDLLSNIGKKFKVPYQMLMKINNIKSPQLLRAGETIKVIEGPFHAKVSLSTFTMELYLGDTYVKSFKVGLGRPGNETPTGLWLVKADGKMIKPTWTDPDTGKTYESEDPDYPLGSRWIGLDGLEGNARDRTGFAIHGTKDANEIGRATSRGCIRLHNGNAILMYNVLMPGISQVRVVD